VLVRVSSDLLNDDIPPRQGVPENPFPELHPGPVFDLSKLRSGVQLGGLAPGWRLLMPKKIGIDVTNMSSKELAEVGAPYFVDPDDLHALGVNPSLYLKSFGSGAGWMLDRKKDAVLIERLRSMQLPHRTMQ
jgi:hypothetical protein